LKSNECMIFGHMSDSIRDRILIVDDDLQVSTGLEALLSDDWEVKTASDGRSAIVAFGEFSPDVVLLDVHLPDTTGIELLHQFKMYSESTAVIMMSGAGTLDRVVESMKLGAETFLQKPFDFETLAAVLQQVSGCCDAPRAGGAPARRSGADRQAAGHLAGHHALNDISATIARAPSPVLIEGESGTGKGVMARLIHNRSRARVRRSSI
jgi:DNA-binding NtrC family response regulator